ncbi:MAG: tetratricopeptide repeat protein [Parvibaculales bacterium]
MARIIQLFPLIAASLLAACSGSDKFSLEKSENPLLRTQYAAQIYEQSPNDSKAALAYARHLRGLGSYGKALQVLERAETITPNHPKLLHEYGKTLLVLGRFGDAQVKLSRASLLDKGHWQNWSLLGVALDYEQQPDRAEHAHSQALKLSNEGYTALVNMGVSLLLSGKWEEASFYLERADAHKKADGYARQNLALALGLQGNYKKAAALARQDMPEKQAQENIRLFKSFAKTPSWELLGVKAQSP